MIPKIIHLCWLSGDEFPNSIRECLKSWNTYLADYEFWLWGKKPIDCLDLNIIEKSFDIKSTVWTYQAFVAQKYAFAADYIRLYAVYNYGGIYLDSDVMMYKSFDDLLRLPYFIGEDMVHCFEPAIFGAEKGTSWLKIVLDRYIDLDFVEKDGSHNMLTLPSVFHQRLTPNFKFELSKKTESYIYRDGLLRIFPKEYFNSRNYIKPIFTKDSYCSHHFVGSWLKKQSHDYNVKNLLPDFIVNIVYAFAYNILYKKSLSYRQIPYINR